MKFNYRKIREYFLESSKLSIIGPKFAFSTSTYSDRLDRLFCWVARVPSNQKM